MTINTSQKIEKPQVVAILSEVSNIGIANLVRLMETEEYESVARVLQIIATSVQFINTLEAGDK